MPRIDRRLVIAVPIVVVVVFLLGFALGRGTGSSGEAITSEGPTSTVVAASESQDGLDTSEAEGDAPTTTVAIDGDASVVLPSPPPEPGDIPTYGTEADRNAMITGLVEAGVTGGTRDDVLATADYVCYTLERLRTQGRSLSFTVRVVWNDSLADLPPEDLSAFGAVLSAAPGYLCPEYAAFGENVSYWLGY